MKALLVADKAAPLSPASREELQGRLESVLAQEVAICYALGRHAYVCSTLGVIVGPGPSTTARGVCSGVIPRRASGGGP